MADDVEGARSFQVTGRAYDSFMGRYSGPLAVLFADAAGVRHGHSALDVGCGPGALTGVLVDRLGAASVGACDPSAPFLADCAARHPGADVRTGRAEELPFGDDSFDHGLALLVLHFMSDPARAVREMSRVVRPGGVVGACVWDATGMQMLARFWDAAAAVEPTATAEAMRFGQPGEIAELFQAGGVVDVVESTLEVSSTYADFDELWAGYMAGVGPAGAFCASLSDERRGAVEHELFRGLGSPDGPITLPALARCAIGIVPT